MHALFVMGGPGVKQYERKYPAKIVDIAPTISTILGLDIPAQAEGSVLYDFVNNVKAGSL